MEGQGTTGGLTTEIEANAKIQELADAVKPAVQEKLGRELQVYQAKSYCLQVVAGIFYFIKILTGSADEYIHVKILVALPHLGGDVSLYAVQDQKKLSNPITYF